MKEKIKNYIFGGAVFYSITIIALMIISLVNSITTVELYDNEDNLVKIKQYKQELLKLENNNCTDIINKMIKFYENTSYNGETNLKEVYDFIIGEQGYLLYYTKVKENCNLSDEKMKEYNFPAKFVTISISNDQLFQRYYFQYELSIKDVFSRYIMSSNLINVEYNIRKQYELEVIASLLELEKKKGEEINE